MKALAKRVASLALALWLAPALAAQNTTVMPTSGPLSMSSYSALLNAGLLSIVSNYSGSSAPAAAVQYQFWVDTSTTPKTLKIYDGSSWLPVGFIDTSGHSWSAVLPNPSASSLGGVESYAAVTHQWLDSISTSGVPHSSQPAFSDISGSLSSTQLPAFSGDVSTSAGSSVTSIGANKVSDSMLRQSAGLSLIGRSANSTGNVGDISASAASDCAFRESSSTIGCGTLATGAFANNAVTYAKIQQVAASRLWGNPTGSAANGSEISLGSTLAFSGSALQTGPGTGDVSWSANSFSTTLATVNSNVGSFGSSTNCPSFTVNGKGLITAASQATCTPAVGSITGLGSGIATWLATPSSANLAAAVSDETGSGALVFGTGPSLSSPSISGGTADNATIGGTTPAAGTFTDLTAANKIRLNNAVTSTQITADQNDYTGTDGTNTCSAKKTIRISSDAARNITGLSCSQADGDLIAVLNVGLFPITLKDENSSSTDANRFGFGADLALGSKQGALLIYDGTASRFRQVGGPSASGGGSGTVTQVNSGTGLSGGPITTSGTLSLDINGLTEDTSPDASADFVATYDASAGSIKKAKLQNIAPAADVKKVSTLTASNSSSLDFTGLDTTTCNTFKIILRNVVPATNNVRLLVRIGTGATPTWQATGYSNDDGGAETTGFNVNGDTNNVGNASGIGYSGEAVISNLGGSQTKLLFVTGVFVDNSSNIHSLATGGKWSTTAGTGLRVIASSGNISTGAADLYCYK